MYLCSCILQHPNVQSIHDWYLISVYKWPICVCLHSHASIGKYFLLSLLKSPSTHKIFNNNPLINNIIQVITFWEPASQHFLCYYCIFNVLVHSNSCILSSIVTCLINREIKTNVTPHRVVRHPIVLYRFIPGRVGWVQTNRPIYSVHGNMKERPTSPWAKSGVFDTLLLPHHQGSHPSWTALWRAYHFPGMGVPHSYQPT